MGSLWMGLQGVAVQYGLRMQVSGLVARIRQVGMHIMQDGKC